MTGISFKAMPPDPRKLALEVLNQLDGANLTLDAAVDRVAPEATFGSRRDRALFNALVYGTLRWRRRLDHILAHFTDRPLKKIDPRVLNILRLGVFQIAFLDRIPASAAVNTAVNLVRSLAAPWAVPFVNAVLRRTCREHARVPFPPIEDQSTAALAVNKSFPDWLMARWLKRFGVSDSVHLCDAINHPATITLRANTLKTSAEELLSSVRELTENAARTTFAPDGIRIGQAIGSLFKHPIFQNGWCAVQDEAAQLISLLVNPQPGERVLDGCAGLGGKSAHLAQMMQNQGKVIAVERNAARLDMLEVEMKRLGISIVEPVALPLDKAVTSGKLDRQFDRILVDAPCSGLGVLRRNPDIKWSPLKTNLDRYQRIQAELLELSAPWVKPKGVLIYAVCSSEPEETEAVVAGFLKNHPEFAISSEPRALAKARYSSLLTAGILRTYPKQVDMDGFFGVRFRRV